MANKKETNVYKKLRENPWIIATIVMGILAIFLIWNISSNQGGQESDFISKEKAGEKVISIMNAQAPEGQEAEVKNVTEEKGLYKVVISSQGREMPVYVTKDGESLAQAVMSFEEIKKMQEAQQQAAQQQEDQTQ